MQIFEIGIAFQIKCQPFNREFKQKNNLLLIWVLVD
jgi:hypothetical protein